MDDSETFTLLGLTIDPTTKAIQSTQPPSKALSEELNTLYLLQRALLTLDTPGQIPPPPVPVAQKRTANISKLRESGNADYKKGNHQSAIKYYSLGLQMALGRPLWEPSGLVRDEVAGLYANRAQAHMALGSWAEGAVDAEASVEAKKLGNAKAWWRRGKCLLEMGRVGEAREWVSRGLEMEGGETDLQELMKEIEKKEAVAARN